MKCDIIDSFKMVKTNEGADAELNKSVDPSNESSDLIKKLIKTQEFKPYVN